MDWKDFWDITAHIAAVVGSLAAAVWAYFNFIRSRTYYPRLELTVSGELRTRAGCQYVVPRITLENIGRAKVRLLQDGSGYRMWTSGGYAEETGELVWSGGNVVFPVFQHHRFIEPGERIFDEQQMFVLPAGCIAARIEARLVAPVGWPHRKNSEWNCSAVIGPVPDRDPLA